MGARPDGGLSVLPRHENEALEQVHVLLGALEQGGQRKGWDPSFPNLAPL